MIATVADTATFETYVGNIITAWNAASEDQVVKGRDWYPAARRVAALMSEGDVRAGAGVIASLSPQKNWNLNIKLAGRAFESGVARGNVGDACAKAQRIMLGEDPLEVLPDESKSWSFFKCILDPTDPDAVVVDRHAHDVCVGEIYGSRDRGLSSKRRYATIAHCYREAARRLGELPQVVQAVTWTYQTESVVADLPHRPKY